MYQVDGLCDKIMGIKTPLFFSFKIRIDSIELMLALKLQV